jgi:hypothetical protein
MVTPFERAASGVLPEDAAPERATACDPYAGAEAGHLSALLGRPLVNRRGATVDQHDVCNLFGDGVRVRLVTLVSSVTEDSARLRCHAQAGAAATFAPGIDSLSWQGEEGVYTAQQGQCIWTQVYRDGALDLAASVTVAQEIARRAAI